MEWYVTNSNGLDRFGLGGNDQTCVDGDPSCDFDPNPGMCEFQVVICLNNSEPKLPVCSPNGLMSTIVLRPQPLVQRWRDIFAADLSAVQNAVVHLLDPQNPAAGYVYRPPLDASQEHFCSAPFPIDVPTQMWSTRSTRGSVTLVTRSTDNSLPVSRQDYSQLKLSCESHQ